MARLFWAVCSAQEHRAALTVRAVRDPYHGRQKAALARCPRPLAVPPSPALGPSQDSKVEALGMRPPRAQREVPMAACVRPQRAPSGSAPSTAGLSLPARGRRRAAGVPSVCRDEWSFCDRLADFVWTCFRPVGQLSRGRWPPGKRLRLTLRNPACLPKWPHRFWFPAARARAPPVRHPH